MTDQAGNPEPDEPGEIGWPANADAAHDPSVPLPGSGGAKAEVPEPTPPTTGEVPVEEWTPDPEPEVEETPEEVVEEVAEESAE